MHSPQDLIEDVRFKRVVENVHVRIWLDLLQHNKQSWAREEKKGSGLIFILGFQHVGLFVHMPYKIFKFTVISPFGLLIKFQI